VFIKEAFLLYYDSIGQEKEENKKTGLKTSREGKSYSLDYVAFDELVS